MVCVWERGLCVGLQLNIYSVGWCRILASAAPPTASQWLSCKSNNNVEQRKSPENQPGRDWRMSEHWQLFHYGANKTVEKADIAFNNAAFESPRVSAAVRVFSLINANGCATTHICILKVQNSIYRQVSSQGRF